MMKPPEKSKVVRKLRRAVYTRKSSEERLEQKFNSLHAQREACEAYIASQRSEGWVLVREQYDDGGISGGTLERPGLGPTNFPEFPFFLDEVLFSDKPKIATLENIRTDFGDTSRAFINSINALTQCLPALERQSELKVAFEQWNRFLSIAYGQFDNSPKLFLVHTYLSVFAKFIAYSVLAREPVADEDTIRRILSGRIFDRLNVERFV